MEAIEALFLNKICGPGFAAIQMCAGDVSMVYFDLGPNSQFVVVPRLFDLVLPVVAFSYIRRTIKYIYKQTKKQTMFYHPNL